MTQLMATKAFPYATRRLKAGDLFTARTSADARALVALGKATPAATEDRGQSPVEKLRDEYMKVFGKKPYMGWDADALSKKISEAKSA